jgi:regulatory protein
MREPEVLICMIGFSDGSSFSIKTSYLPCGTLVDRDLSGEEEDALRFAASCLRAERSALRLVARAEQTVFGLSRKLKSRGHKADAVQAAVSRLCSLDIVSDDRFATLWLQARLSRKPDSPRRLLAALKGRGIDMTLARQALEAILTLEAESQLLEACLEKRLIKGHVSMRRASIHKASIDKASIDKASTQDLRRILRFEGFSGEAIQLWNENME